MEGAGGFSSRLHEFARIILVIPHRKNSPLTIPTPKSGRRRAVDEIHLAGRAGEGGCTYGRIEEGRGVGEGRGRGGEGGLLSQGVQRASECVGRVVGVGGPHVL